MTEFDSGARGWLRNRSIMLRSCAFRIAYSTLSLLTLSALVGYISWNNDEYLPSTLRRKITSGRDGFLIF